MRVHDLLYQVLIFMPYACYIFAFLSSLVVCDAYFYDIIASGKDKNGHNRQ